MGVPGLYGKWLTARIAQSILEGLPLLTAGLSFDMNGVFHDARKQVTGEGITDVRALKAIAQTPPEQLELEIFNAAAGVILRMVEAANPREYLLLMVDGVAPGAKLQQQKGRREKAARERSPNESFDRNAITPGTDFMMRMDNFIVRFITKYRDQLPPKIIYSSHLVPGEGEHKIMDYYRSGELTEGEIAKKGGAHILYGLDADLIMLSLMTPLNNIILCRETVLETVSIDRIREFLKTKSNRDSAIDDFVVMMFLLGNDFLPHNPAFEEMAESIDAILEIYATNNYVLTQTDANGRHEINWTDMKRFIAAVADKENELLAVLAVKPVTYPSRFLQAALRQGQFYPDVFRSAWYTNALGPKGPQELTSVLEQIISRYQPTEYDVQLGPYNDITRISEVTPDRITNMSIDYMRTMSWIYLYYREGTDAINHDWSYTHYHTPMLVDLSAVMQLVGPLTEEQQGPPIIIDGFEAHDGMMRFTALHQLVAVMPLKSRDLLPPELQPLFSYNSIIRDLFPDTFIVEMDGKNKMGRGPVSGTPIVPMIDRQRIFEAVQQVVFSPERAEIFMPATPQLFVLTPDEVELVNRRQFDRQRQAEFLARQAKRGRGRGGDRGGRGGRGGREGEQQRRPYQPNTQQGLVPTMNQTAQNPRSPGRGRGRGEGRGGWVDRGGRGRGWVDRGGRGRGGDREGGQPEIRRTPTIPVTAQTPTQAPTTPTTPTTIPIRTPVTVQQAPTRGGQTVIQRGPPTVPGGTVTTAVVPAGRGTNAGAPPRLPTVPVGVRAPPTVPVGAVAPAFVPRAVPVAAAPPPVVPVGAAPQPVPRSPAQWKQLPVLM